MQSGMAGTSKTTGTSYFIDKRYVSVKNTFLHIKDDDESDQYQEYLIVKRARSCPPAQESSAMGSTIYATEVLQEPQSSKRASSWADVSDSDSPQDDYIPNIPLSKGYQDNNNDETHEENFNRKNHVQKWCGIQDDETDSTSCGSARGSARSTEAPAGNPGEPEEPVTTMMIRNIPFRWSKDKVLDYVNAVGFQGQYDFFYLPQSWKHNSNFGYAFINFKTVEAATDFQFQMNGLSWHKFSTNAMLRQSESQKICHISPADIQGLENMKKHFLGARVVKTSRAPSFFLDADVDDDIDVKSVSSSTTTSTSSPVVFSV